MALGYYFHPDAMSADQYDRVILKLEEAGAGSPPGRAYHCSFQVGDNVHVFDVWETEEQFNAFGETLMPILQAEGVDPGQPDVSPVHNVIVGK
jgi:hypothetical protein